MFVLTAGESQAPGMCFSIYQTSVNELVPLMRKRKTEGRGAREKSKGKTVCARCQPWGEQLLFSSCFLREMYSWHKEKKTDLKD